MYDKEIHMHTQEKFLSLRRGRASLFLSNLFTLSRQQHMCNKEMVVGDNSHTNSFLISSHNR